MAVGWFACWSAALKWVFQIKPEWQPHVFNPWRRNAFFSQKYLGGLWHSSTLPGWEKKHVSFGDSLSSLKSTRIRFLFKRLVRFFVSEQFGEVQGCGFGAGFWQHQPIQSTFNQHQAPKRAPSVMRLMDFCTGGYGKYIPYLYLQGFLHPFGG